MKTVLNKTYRPLKITFAGGKVLHLGPGKTGQVPDSALEEKSLQALLKASTIEVLGGGATHAQDASGSGAAPREVTRGHRPEMTGTTKGKRGA